MLRKCVTKLEVPSVYSASKQVLLAFTKEEQGTSLYFAQKASNMGNYYQDHFCIVRLTVIDRLHSPTKYNSPITKICHFEVLSSVKTLHNTMNVSGCTNNSTSFVVCNHFIFFHIMLNTVFRASTLCTWALSSRQHEFIWFRERKVRMGFHSSQVHT